MKLIGLGLIEYTGCPAPLSIGRLILGEDIDDPEQTDSYSQMAINMNLLFGNTEVSDDEFNLIAGALGDLEGQFKKNILNGIYWNPVN